MERDLERDHKGAPTYTRAGGRPGGTAADQLAPSAVRFNHRPRNSRRSSHQQHLHVGQHPSESPDNPHGACFSRLLDCDSPSSFSLSFFLPDAGPWWQAAYRVDRFHVTSW